MNCEFCHKIFSSKSSLNLHKKTALYCLRLRNEEINKIKEIENLECKYCEKNYFRKDYLKKHLLVCKQKFIFDNQQINEDNLKLKEQVQENEKKLEIIQNRLDDFQNFNNQLVEIAKAPKKIINNTSIKNDNKLNLFLSPSDVLSNPERVKQIFREKYNSKHLMKGIEGLASFSIEYLLKTSDGKYCYLCTDPSRKTFVLMNQDRSINKDLECTSLINTIYGPVKEVSNRLYNNIEYDHNELIYQLNEALEDGYVEINDENYNKQLELINIERNRKDFAFDRKLEIQNLKQNKNKFIKSLSIPLHNCIKQ
jgi:hypothetical protein